MDYDKYSGWFACLFCYGHIYFEGDSCDMGDDREQCSDGEHNDEYCFWYESCSGDCCRGNHNRSCTSFSYSVCKHGVRLK